MIAGKWMDMVVGVDIHWVLVPAPPAPVPIPTPLPHPFVGLIYDPIGLAVGLAIGAAISLATGGPVTGPVLINNMPASNTGTEGTNKMVMPHFPTPPGVGWAPVPAGLKPPIPGKQPDPGIPTPVPSNDAIIVTGSKTVYVMGTNATRLGDLAMSCGEPIRLPSSTVIAVPMGPPVLIGGPPALDFMAAAFGAIRTSWVSGRLHALFRATEGSWRSKVICFLTGHPVDVVSGMVLTDAIDFRMKGPIPFRFERNYCSKSTASGPVGIGWHHSCDLWLRQEKGRVVVHWEDGRLLYFDEPVYGGATTNQAECATLEGSAGAFVVTMRDGRRLHFMATARDDGTVPVDRIEDADGNRLTFSYDYAGRLQSVIDPRGRKVNFDHDERGLLIALRADHPDGDGASTEVARYEYNEARDLVRVFDALGHSSHYDYDNHLLVQETDRTGFSFYFSYDGSGPDARCVRTWGDGGLYDRVLTYVPEKSLTIEQDSSGATTFHHTNEAGLVDRQVDALGGETLFEWDEWGRPLGETRVTGAAVTFEYHPNGRIARGTDPLGNSRSYDWDERGRLRTMTDEAGGEWRLDYGRWSRPVRLTDPAGGATTYRYDADGSIEAVTGARGVMTRLVRSRGNGGRLGVDLQVGGQPTASMAYDAWGRLSRLRAGTGEEVVPVWNLRSELAEITFTDGRVRRFGYDGEGHLTRIDYPSGDWVEREFHGPGLLRSISYSDGQRVEIDRDGEGREIEIRAPSGSVRFERDPIGRVTGLSYSDGRTRSYEYVDGGRIQKVMDALGRRGEFEYDLNDRLVRVTGWDGYEASFAFDARGLLVGMANDSAEITLERDVRGHIVEEQRGDLIVRSEYGRDGLRTRRSWSWGEHSGSTDYSWDSFGRLVGLTADRFAIGLERDSRARIREIVLGESIRVRRETDVMGRLRRQIVTAAGEREEITQNFDYDAEFRLIERSDPRGPVQTFGYDPSGSLAWYEREGTRHEVQTNSEGSVVGIADRAIQLGPGGRVTASGGEAIGYDPVGCIVSRSGPDLDGVRYEFDSRQRLRKVLTTASGNGRSSDELVASYEYDALGRRIAKNVGGTRTEFAWDGVQAFLTRDASTGQVHEYLSLPRALSPIGRSGSDGTEYYLWDERGVPSEVFDAQGHSIRQGWANPFGDGTDAPTEWTLPGYLFDAESGLCYGGARYLDPSMARFLTPDPFEPAIGRLAYEYPSDPLGWIDFWALYIIGLGHGRGLDEFAKSTGERLGEDIITYKNADQLPKLPEMSTEGWGHWTHELVGQSDAARFSLNGIDDVAQAYQNGAKVVAGEQQARDIFGKMGLDPPNLGGVKGDIKVTHIELFQLLRRDGPLDDSLKKFFDANGNEVDIEKLRAQCGI